MNRVSRLAIPIAVILVSAPSVKAQEPRPLGGAWYPIPRASQFLTGDSWSYQTVTYRLYGVQSCLRGTTFRNAHDIELDCGEASLVVLAAMIKDLTPFCSTVTEDVAQRIRFVVCMSTIRSGAAKGKAIDLGTAIITQGYAMAAMKADGSLVHPAYGVAEDQARRQKLGLWQFAFPNPNAIIAQTLRGQLPTQPRHTPPPPAP
jgi:endonuclease YncB( thermonuclease family)